MPHLPLLPALALVAGTLPGGPGGTPFELAAGPPPSFAERIAAAEVAADPSLLGYSGALRAVVVNSGDPVTLPLRWSGAAPGPVSYRWTPTHGTRTGDGLLGEPASFPLDPSGSMLTPAQGGVWRLGFAAGVWERDLSDLAVITRVGFEQKRGGFLNGYHIGRYPTEDEGRIDVYAPPRGFIEVTPANQDLQISEHFRLRNFLTKDQFSVWPKYVALDLRLIDKLELVLQELRAMGIQADAMAVMSGFRTPQYNGPGEGGRARLSRHMYGDASDVWVDNDGDGYIDDLNGDGRRDTGDARIMLRAVDRVERRYPQLVGGCGVYDSNSAHGPFVHIDVRGTYSRW